MKTPNHPIYVSTKDYFKSQEPFDLVRDSSGEILITTPQPAPEKMASYYQDQEYISHSDTGKGLIPFLYRLVQKRSLKQKVKLINKLSSHKGTLLDIGAGTGAFCQSMTQDSWQVYGVEPNENARETAAQKKLFLHQNIQDFKGQQFDVVTLWHVLEHLPNLDKTIKDIQQLVKPNGLLIIAVPNYNSFDAKHYKGFWAAYDTPRHLWHFSQKAMRGLFSKNMKLLKTKPMIFDSFYVSLLSEKYKSGNNFSLKGLWVGLMSNLSAVKTKEYSSLIYCFKKG